MAKEIKRGYYLIVHDQCYDYSISDAVFESVLHCSLASLKSLAIVIRSNASVLYGKALACICHNLIYTLIIHLLL